MCISTIQVNEVRWKLIAIKLLALKYIFKLIAIKLLALKYIFKRNTIYVVGELQLPILKYAYQYYRKMIILSKQYIISINNI